MSGDCIISRNMISFFNKKKTHPQEEKEEKTPEELALRKFYEKNYHNFRDLFIVNGTAFYKPTMNTPTTVRDQEIKDHYTYDEFKKTFKPLMIKLKNSSVARKQAIVPDDIKNYDINSLSELDNNQRRIRQIQKFVLDSSDESNQNSNEKNDGGKRRKSSKKRSSKKRSSKKRSKKSTKKRSTKKRSTKK